jgi:hypothetical protein
MCSFGDDALVNGPDSGKLIIPLHSQMPDKTPAQNNCALLNIVFNFGLKSTHHSRLFLLFIVNVSVLIKSPKIHSSQLSLFFLSGHDDLDFPKSVMARFILLYTS